MIIVTGAAGFIGGNITRALLSEGQDFFAVDDLSFGDKRNIPSGVEFMQADFDKLCRNREYSTDDVLIHCATSNIIYAMGCPVETFKNNAEKTIELFRRFPGRIIYTSTASVYGNADVFPINEEAPTRVYNAYDTSKRVAELYLMSRGSYTTLRLSNVYGEHQLASNPYCGVVGRLIDCALTGKTFYAFGNDTRDYTYIGDVVKAVLMLIKRGSLFTEINIGTGQETSLAELLRLIRQLTGKTICLRDDIPRAIDKISRRCLDVRKAEQVFGWKPETHLGEGLIKTIEWYRYAKQITSVQSEVSSQSKVIL